MSDRDLKQEFEDNARDIRGLLEERADDAEFDEVRPHYEALLRFYEWDPTVSLADVEEHWAAISEIQARTSAALAAREAELDEQIAEGHRRLFGGPSEPQGKPN